MRRRMPSHDDDDDSDSITPAPVAKNTAAKDSNASTSPPSWGDLLSDSWITLKRVWAQPDVMRFLNTGSGIAVLGFDERTVTQPHSHEIDACCHRLIESCVATLFGGPSSSSISMQTILDTKTL